MKIKWKKQNSFRAACIAAWVLVLSVYTLSAQSVDSLFQIATQAYQEEGYAAAGHIFKDLANAENKTSPELLSNAAIAFAKVDSLGLAMWVTQKGLRLAQRNTELNDIEKHLESRLEGMVIFESSADQLVVKWWIWAVALVLLILLLLLFIIPWHLNPKVQRGLAIAILPCFLVLIIHFFWWRTIDTARGVVIHSGQELLDMPEGNSNFEVSAGQMANAVEEEGDWIKIILPDGVGGWIEKEHFRMIE